MVYWVRTSSEILGEAGLDAVYAELGIGLSAGRGRVERKDVVAHLEREVDAVEEAKAGDGGIADERGIDGNLVLLEILHDVLYFAVLPYSLPSLMT